ncbi:unnamed protein product, partial [marine sediment metagenome]
ARVRAQFKGFQDNFLEGDPPPARVIRVREGEPTEVAHRLVDLHLLARRIGVRPLLRAGRMEIEGFVTEKLKPSRTPGKDRRWVAGVKLNGGKREYFEEPLDFYNPETGRLETCLCIEKDTVVVTARQAPGVSDKLDDFVWLSYPAGRVQKKLINRIGKLMQERVGIENELHSLRIERDKYEIEANRSASEWESMTKKLKGLEEENTRLKEQIDHLQSLLPAHIASKIKEGAKQTEALKEAEKLGAFEGKSIFG